MLYWLPDRGSVKAIGRVHAHVAVEREEGGLGDVLWEIRRRRLLSNT
mgnify:CR=1 FL=1